MPNISHTPCSNLVKMLSWSKAPKGYVIYPPEYSSKLQQILEFRFLAIFIQPYYSLMCSVIKNLGNHFRVFLGWTFFFYPDWVIFFVFLPLLMPFLSILKSHPSIKEGPAQNYSFREIFPNYPGSLMILSFPWTPRRYAFSR